MTSPLAICPDSSDLEDSTATVEPMHAAAGELSEECDSDWYDDEAIGGGASGFADAPQGW